MRTTRSCLRLRQLKLFPFMFSFKSYAYRRKAQRINIHKRFNLVMIDCEFFEACLRFRNYRKLTNFNQKTTLSSDDVP